MAAERIVYPLVGARYETASWVNKAASAASAAAAVVISFYHRQSRREKKVDDAEPPAFEKFPNSRARALPLGLGALDHYLRLKSRFSWIRALSSQLQNRAARYELAILCCAKFLWV